MLTLRDRTCPCQKSRLPEISLVVQNSPAAQGRGPVFQFGPVQRRDGRLVGLVVLGALLSEEPYSREDHQLLASVASQAALALESIRLGEKIAERIEVERRTAQEMELAREGACIQARHVGGDYTIFSSFVPVVWRWY